MQEPIKKKAPAPLTKCLCPPLEEPHKVKKKPKEPSFYLDNKRRNGLEDELDILDLDATEKKSASSLKDADVTESVNGVCIQCNLPSKPSTSSIECGKCDVEVVVAPPVEVKGVDAYVQSSSTAVNVQPVRENYNFSSPGKTYFDENQLRSTKSTSPFGMRYSAVQMPPEPPLRPQIQAIPTQCLRTSNQPFNNNNIQTFNTCMQNHPVVQMVPCSNTFMSTNCTKRPHTSSLDVSSAGNMFYAPNRSPSPASSLMPTPYPNAYKRSPSASRCPMMNYTSHMRSPSPMASSPPVRSPSLVRNPCPIPMRCHTSNHGFFCTSPAPDMSHTMSPVGNQTSHVPLTNSFHANAQPKPMLPKSPSMNNTAHLMHSPLHSMYVKGEAAHSGHRPRCSSSDRRSFMKRLFNKHP
ncbi:unnamed protein product [Phyllotreta striolata]|uniref:Uncharacterized protein n=1 Tax=Phyllotreta striolata TaxID=444603 RepID=A0A9N9XKY4_PHYSR|nr:unnamed protein product [Phyllotreta striolata]